MVAFLSKDLLQDGSFSIEGPFIRWQVFYKGPYEMVAFLSKDLLRDGSFSIEGTFIKW